MLLEMHREPVEQSWVLPVVGELESVFQLIDEKGVYAVVANFTKTLGIELFGVDRSRAGLHEFSFSVGEGFNILLFSQFDTLCYIYPQFMPPERLYGIKFSRGLLTKNILQTRYKEMAGYAEFQTLISSTLRGKKSAVPTTITRILSASDEWWLEELGFRERIMSVRKGLKLIASNIEAVSARRESILEAFI